MSYGVMLRIRKEKIYNTLSTVTSWTLITVTPLSAEMGFFHFSRACIASLAVGGGGFKESCRYLQMNVTRRQF